MTAALAALLPPIGVAVLFWLVMRAIVRADRAERAAQAKFDRQQGLVPGGEETVSADFPKARGADAGNPGPGNPG